MEFVTRDERLLKLAAELRAPAEPTAESTAESGDDVLPTLTAAVRARGVVRIAYIDHAGERTRRDVEAQGLVLAPNGDYLVGWCRLREATRQFRVDRITAAHRTDGAARPHDLDDLIAVLPVPTPRAPADRAAGTPPLARDWTLGRIQRVRLRLAETTAGAEVAARPPTARPAPAVAAVPDGPAVRLRAVIGHLAEWTRWQVAAVRAVTTGQDLVFDGRRPDFPRRFDDDGLGYLARERMIQAAMASRSVGELVRDLDEVLDGAAGWAAGCPQARWHDQVPEPGRPGHSRPLADLLAGWWSPLSHVEWHLDRLDRLGRPDRVDAAADAPRDLDAEPDDRLVTRCPLRA